MPNDLHVPVGDRLHRCATVTAIGPDTRVELGRHGVVAWLHHDGTALVAWDPIASDGTPAVLTSAPLSSLALDLGALAGMDAGRRVLAEAQGLDACGGVRLSWRSSAGAWVLSARDGDLWIRESSGPLSDRAVPALATIDPADPNADALALAACLRAVLGVSDAG